LARLTVAENIDFRLAAGARHALIGPNGAGKTTFINMLTGRLAPSSGAVLLGGADITALAQSARVKRGLGRTFQINTLFRELSVLDNVALGVAERLGVAGRFWRAASAYREVRDEALALLGSLGLARTRASACSTCPTASSGWSRSPSRWDSSPACCCSMSRPRRAFARIGAHPGGARSPAGGDRDPDHRTRHGARVPLRAAHHGARAGSGAVRGHTGGISADRRVREVYLGEGHG
jgi:ABC-type branched-subunit amino acid transport system ATPase component